MTNAFSSMEYPHWLIVAGAALLVLGFIGLAFRQRKGAEAELNERANGNERGPSEFEAELQTQAANRRAKLAEQKRERGADKDRGSKEEPWNDMPKLSDKEQK